LRCPRRASQATPAARAAPAGATTPGCATSRIPTATSFSPPCGCCVRAVSGSGPARVLSGRPRTSGHDLHSGRDLAAVVDEPDQRLELLVGDVRGAEPHRYPCAWSDHVADA